MSTSMFLCAACIAARPNDQDAAWGSEWATTVYRGNALCLTHFREVRIQEQNRALQAQASQSRGPSAQ